MEPILDEKSFQDKYWFDNYVHITVVNPTTDDFTFPMVVQTGIDRATGRLREEHRTFTIRAGEKERFVGSVANLYLDMMSKHLSQRDNRFGDMSDWNAKAKYYNDLIVDKDDPYHDASFVPFNDLAATQQIQTVQAEQPFAGALAAANTEKADLAAKLADAEREKADLLAQLAASKESPPNQSEHEEQPFAMAGKPGRKTEK